ncbi:MAG: c-type cytochrome [Gammaproteobacteria bacterium]|nr:c-type cytochrome [Gammaproteobacteria bacterium]
MRKQTLIVLCTALWSGVLMFTSATAADPAIAEAVAAGKAKAGACAACHGPNGQSSQPMWPNLAGQGAAYTVKQLKAFKSKTRDNAQMAPMVATLTEEDMVNLGVYYQTLSPAKSTAKGDISAGEALYRGGDRAKNIPACMSCHGPAGGGMPLAGFPSVGGQHADYSYAQLEAFASGTRDGGVQGMMGQIAKRLDKAAMRSLAQYMAGLR